MVAAEYKRLSPSVGGEQSPHGIKELPYTAIERGPRGVQRRPTYTSREVAMASHARQHADVGSMVPGISTGKEAAMA